MIKYLEAIEELPAEIKLPLIRAFELFKEEVAETVKRSDFERFERATEENFRKVWESIYELAEAQKRTEEEVRKLWIGLNRTREDLGGLSRSFGYAFENEAYRMLPGVLKEKYGIELKERFIRTEIRGQEINFLARAKRDGEEVYIVGEARVRLDDTKKREDVFKELNSKIKAVKEEYGDIETQGLLVSHFATKGFLKKAEEKGILVVLSYEW